MRTEQTRLLECRLESFDYPVKQHHISLRGFPRYEALSYDGT
jgi:hypothetical protein